MISFEFIQMTTSLIASIPILFAIFLILFTLSCRIYFSFRKHERQKGKKEKIIGFYHPHCCDGGGGERVLWKSLEALAPMIVNHRIIIFSKYATPKEKLRQHVQNRFDIYLPNDLNWEVLQIKELSQQKPPLRFTMLMESWQTMVGAWYAMKRCTPDVFIDTTGCAFTFFVVKCLAGCPKIAAYVHYPTISTVSAIFSHLKMIEKVLKTFLLSMN